MIWGCMYDAMLRWAKMGKDGNKIKVEGSYNLDSTFNVTGNNIDDVINNIYDLQR